MERYTRLASRRFPMLAALGALLCTLWFAVQPARAVQPTILTASTSTGTGTAIDVSAFMPIKTVTYAGGLAGDVTAVEISSNGTNWYQLANYNYGAAWINSYNAYAKWMRINRIATGATTTAGIAYVNGGTAPAPYTNLAFAMSSTSVTSSAVSVASCGQVQTIYYMNGSTGDFTVIEATKDGTTWNPIISEPGAAWITNISGGNLSVRLNRTTIGNTSVTATAFLMAEGQGAQGLVMEVPTGTPNGARRNFDLSRIPSTPNTVMLFQSYPLSNGSSTLSGQLQSYGNNYTLASGSTTIVFASTSTPATSTAIMAVYW